MDRTHVLNHPKDIVSGKIANSVIGLAFFVLATVLGSYVRIPVAGSPVPITLQTLFVLLSGAVLGRRLGALAQFLLFVTAGAYILGPTGGYMLGFIPAAYLVGLMSEKRPFSRVGAIASFAAGSIVIYACGVLWLVLAYKMNVPAAIAAGVLPFVPGDVAKICLAAIIYSSIDNRTKKIFQI